MFGRTMFGMQAVRLGAASIVMLGVVALGTWLVRSRQSGSPTEAHVYQTAPGQRSTVRLADGSTMLLAPSTSVSMRAHERQRELTVTGEAYFTVASHSNQPLIVRTRNAVVRVLGTRFSVRQYPDESHSRVVVEDGKVSVGPQHGSGATRITPAVLSGRMLAQVSDSGISVSSGIATREYTSWTQGVLVFRGVTLRDAVSELARAYDVDIRVADSALAKQTMRMDVSVRDDAIGKVLATICRVLDAHYTRDGRTFVLAPGRTGATSPSIRPQEQSVPQPEKQYGR